MYKGNAHFLFINSVRMSPVITIAEFHCKPYFNFLKLTAKKNKKNTLSLNFIITSSMVTFLVVW
jgi:hypothetical protein